MNEKINQKLDETAKRIRFGTYTVEFVIHNEEIVKAIIKESSEIILCKLDKEERV